MHNYTIIIFSDDNHLLARTNTYLRIINKDINVSQLIENNKKHALHFNFRDLKNIFVPRTIHDGVKWDQDIIRKNLETLIMTYQNKNKLNLKNKLQAITCNDVANLILMYLDD